MRKQNCEVFFVEARDQTPETCYWNEETGEAAGEGWFYWFCFPGCLPEGDPIGPFKSAALALQDAEDNGYFLSGEEINA